MCPTGHIHVDVHVCDAHLDTYHMRMYTTHMFLYKKLQQFIYHYHMTPYLHTPTNATFKAQSSGHCALQKPHRKGSRYFFCILGEYVNLHVHFALVTWIDRLKSIYTIWNKIRIRYMFQVWLITFREQLLGAPSNRYTFLGGWLNHLLIKSSRPLGGERTVDCSTRMVAPAGAADVVHGFHAKSFGWKPEKERVSAIRTCTTCHQRQNL